MRPLRVVFSLLSCIAAFVLLVYIGASGGSYEDSVERQRSIGSYFNWHSPSALFPPSAIISLTDDNSTFFPARPAAFGPLLPASSLSGQLWIGSGFGDDHVGRSGSEGEFGCSDVPGWGDGSYVSGGQSLNQAKSSWSYSQDMKSRGRRKRDVSEDEYEEDQDDEPILNDGTDDHLHHPLPPSADLKTSGGSASSAKKSTHADIQSLQESAEIAGKIVLLSRGGCGFLEKVKWVQRRGGVALIVGDDVRGGPLVTMYARGDTSNVTIPSLFISHTTAHLLTTLVPSGSVTDILNPDEAERLGLALGHKADTQNQKSVAVDKPNFTTTTASFKSTPTVKSQTKEKSHKDVPVLDEPENANEREKIGWLESFFGKGGNAESRRPPGSGHIGWVLQEEFEDDDLSYGRVGRQSTTSTTSTSTPTPSPDPSSGDGFVIGVQDWRDPDLVAHQKERFLASASRSLTSTSTPSSTAEAVSGLKGGSITPGSGEYVKPLHDDIDLQGSGKSSQADSRSKASGNYDGSASWLGRLFQSRHKEITESTSTKERLKMLETASHLPNEHSDDDTEEPEVREGLWVTLTPTSMSSSPFFDTLLVLVVSPLVTLTIVYALLLLRSRIRRRRWRAPKSVVERLPVRTYQTMPSTTTTSSTTSSISSRVTATTPLLPSDARPINARPRPRSRTASEVPVQHSSSLRSDSVASPSPDQIEEKRSAGLSEWRRRYGGKQRECVVCLEEYIDGVSRVMSLPCGHEFHAECITPWLTTRRRTCPICKGDVVRSLARSSGTASASPPQGSYQDDEDSDTIQEQAAVTRNDDPAAAQPVSREDEAFEDLERGMASDRSR